MPQAFLGTADSDGECAGTLCHQSNVLSFQETADPGVVRMNIVPPISLNFGTGLINTNDQDNLDRFWRIEGDLLVLFTETDNPSEPNCQIEYIWTR